MVGSANAEAFLQASRPTSPGASTRRTIGVFSLYLRSVTLPASSLTRKVKTGSVPSLSKVSCRHGDREDSIEPVLAVRGLVAVLSDVPGKDADLIEVVG